MFFSAYNSLILFCFTVVKCGKGSRGGGGEGRGTPTQYTNSVMYLFILFIYLFIYYCIVLKRQPYPSACGVASVSLFNLLPQDPYYYRDRQYVLTFKILIIILLLLEKKRKINKRKKNKQKTQDCCQLVLCLCVQEERITSYSTIFTVYSITSSVGSFTVLLLAIHAIMLSPLLYSFVCICHNQPCSSCNVIVSLSSSIAVHSTVRTSPACSHACTVLSVVTLSSVVLQPYINNEQIISVSISIAIFFIVCTLPFYLLLYPSYIPSIPQYLPFVNTFLVFFIVLFIVYLFVLCLLCVLCACCVCCVCACCVVVYSLYPSVAARMAVPCQGQLCPSSFTTLLLQYSKVYLEAVLSLLSF